MFCDFDSRKQKLGIRSLFGTSTAAVLKKFTAYLAGIFLVVCLILSLWSSAMGRTKTGIPSVNIEEVSGG